MFIVYMLYLKTFENVQSNKGDWKPTHIVWYMPPDIDCAHGDNQKINITDWLSETVWKLSLT